MYVARKNKDFQLNLFHIHLKFWIEVQIFFKSYTQEITLFFQDSSSRSPKLG